MRFRSSAILFFLVLLAIVAFAGCTGRTLGPSGGWSGPVVDVNQDRLYVGSRGGEVLAVDLRDRGGVAWRFPPADEEVDLKTVYGTPALARGHVYVGAWDGNVYALDAQGDDAGGTQLLWGFSTDGEIVGGPVVEGDTLFIGSSDGFMYALDLAVLEEERDGPVVKWKFKTGEKVWSTPAVSNGLVYFGALDHRVYAVDMETGEERWRFEAGGGVASTPLLLGDRVFIGAFDRNFYALDAATGEEVWRFEAGGWFWSGVVSDGETIYAPSLDGKLYALSASGELRWSFDLGKRILAAPALVMGQVAVASDDGILYLVDPQECAASPQGCTPDGKATLWSPDLGDDVRAPLLAVGDVVYVHVRDRTIRAADVESKTVRRIASTRE